MRDPNTPVSTTQTANPEIGRLKRRADFLRAAKGKRWHAGGMTIQTTAGQTTTGQTAAGDDEAAVRVGYTLTRKVGGAVVRNRIRRRLKEAVRASPGLPVRGGHDYVIIGRIEALRLPFETLKRELDRAVRSVHQAGRTGRPRSQDRAPKDPAPKDPAQTRTKPAP